MNALEKLGYAEHTKLLIIHADDAGLSHSENQATILGLIKGSVNSFSIMVPCPWFCEIADFAKDRPQLDYGIHLTLNCEWKYFKWGPILPQKEVPSLVGKGGYFHKGWKDVGDYGRRIEIKKELEAQIEKALDYGLSPTHLDTHMHVMVSKPEFLEVYKELGKKYKLPILLHKERTESFGIDLHEREKAGHFWVDALYLGLKKVTKDNQTEKSFSDVLDKMNSGLNVMLIHPAFDNHEMQGIMVEKMEYLKMRQLEFEYFTSDECKRKLLENKIELITWRKIKETLFC